MLSPFALAVGASAILFHFSVNAVLQARHHRRRHPGKPVDWRVWLPPMYIAAHNKLPHHALFATVNVVVAATFAALLADAIVTGRSRVYFSVAERGWPATVGWAVWLFAWEQLAQFVFHLVMHTPYFYAAAHKLHHAYKHPEPFDDLYVHPVEVTAFYVILFSPPMLYPVHIVPLIAYFSLHAVTGILDHSGLSFSLPGVYASVDHDAHHSRFECNYATPFPYPDILWGTYHGDFLGRKYVYRGAGAARAAKQSAAVKKAD